MTKVKVALWLMTLVSTLCLVVACGSLNGLESAPELVLEEVIVGNWAISIPDPDYDNWIWDGHYFEFRSNGEYADKVSYSEVGLVETGSYVVDDSTLQYTREFRTVLCLDIPSTEKFEVLSIEQNKITLKILTHTNNCETLPDFIPSIIGAEVVLERCEWPPNAETEVFAFCMPIESE